MPSSSRSDDLEAQSLKHIGTLPVHVGKHRAKADIYVLGVLGFWHVRFQAWRRGVAIDVAAPTFRLAASLLAAAIPDLDPEDLEQRAQKAGFDTGSAPLTLPR